MDHSHRLQHLALDQDSNIVDIKNTEDNKTYYCPYCKKDMITKKGDIREWHFAHKPEKEEKEEKEKKEKKEEKEKCSYNNYLHSIAEIKIKDWFNSNDQIKLYMSTEEKCYKFKECAFYDGKNCSETKEVTYNLKDYYTKCTLEHKYKGFIADLFCEHKNYPNEPIFIEIYVTSECSQDKINSGIRIIEIPIQSEEDILNITRSDCLIENKTVRLYNFKRKESLSKNYKLPFQKFILYPSTKSYVDRESYSCKNYNNRKGIYEISMPYDECIPYFPFNGGLYMVGKAMAYNEKLLEKDCLICRWKAQDGNGDYLCRLYKKYENPKYCKDNDSSKCEMFKVDLDEIKKAIDAFNEHKKQNNIDIWKKQQ